MAFTAAPANLGVPDFGLIHISPEEVAKAFQTYLNTASRLTGVSLDDISRNVYELPADPSRVTLVELISRGMKMFDAVVWLTAGRPVTHPLRLDPTMSKDTIPTLHEIARAVFYCYFMLVTQARYPASRGSANAPKIPNFLRTIMGMEEDQHIYVEKICTFAPQKFDPAWARHVHFIGFGQEVLSRFGLGVAGYRLFGPFSMYNPKPNITPELQRAFNFARAVATAPSSWNVHPLTRNPNILTARGNLNKNLGNLILEVFTDADIDEMVNAKILYAKPTREPSHRNYMVWAETDDITGSSHIFRQQS
jgi:hypothetical protein